MCLHPDAGVAYWVLGVRVRLAAVTVWAVAVLPDGLIHRHVVRQNLVTQQKLQTMTCSTLADKHCSLKTHNNSQHVTSTTTFHSEKNLTLTLSFENVMQYGVFPLLEHV